MQIRSFFTALALAGLSMATSASALAATADPAATPGIDRRMDNQQRRIDRGAATGQLTPRETARMDRRQDKLQVDVARAKADGVVTAQERRRLNRELDRSSEAIAHEKHDRQHDFNHDGKADHAYRR